MTKGSKVEEHRHKAHALAAITVSPELIRIAWSHRRSGWWLRAPFLPLPSSTHLGWRRETAYGRADAHLAPGDLLEYATWRRNQRRAHP